MTETLIRCTNCGHPNATDSCAHCDAWRCECGAWRNACDSGPCSTEGCEYEAHHAPHDPDRADPNPHRLSESEIAETEEILRRENERLDRLAYR